MKAVIYARVSTDKQDYYQQKMILEGWADNRKLEVVEVYQEKESAWKAGHQIELARLIKNARTGKFQIVLVWALDRLCREGSLAILALVHKLKGYGVTVLSHEESWTEAPGEFGEVLFALTGWVARMESQRRSERTKAGLAARKAKGIRLGRPPGAKDKKKRKRRRDNERSIF